MSSQQVSAIQRYSTSADDPKIVRYFLHFQEITILTNNTQSLVNGCLVLLQPPQSESQNAVKVGLASEAMNRPCPREPFKYLTTLYAAVR